MNGRERVRLALTGGRPDRVPIALAFFPQDLPAIAPVSPEDYFGLDVRFAEFSPPPEQEEFRRYLAGLPDDIHVGDLRQLRTYHEWDYHPEAGPLGPLAHIQTEVDLDRHTFPDLAATDRYADLADQVTSWHAQGHAVAGAPPHLGGELFETAWRLRGFDNFLTDLLIRKPLAHYLLDQILSLCLQSVLLLARAGVDVLLLDDDVAMPTGLLISPAIWREFFRPRLSRLIRAARQATPDILVLYHSDGDFSALVADLLEIGVNAINPVQPDCMDAAVLRARFGPRLAFWGTVGTAGLWDWGAPDAVRAAVQRQLTALGGSGLLLAPAYDIDFAPLANLEAFCAAAREYGQF